MHKKIAMVTGANGGIGRAIIKVLAEQNNYVLAVCRNVDHQKTLNELLGENGEAVILDITDSEQAKNVFSQLKTAEKLPSILVNNAGITQDSLLLRLNEAKWDSVLDTNLKSAFMLMQLAVKHMSKNKWGRVINISSAVARLGNIGQANYAAAKAGLEAVTRVAAAEFARYNITVNAVAPGAIRTPMTDTLDEKVIKGFLQNVPMQRFGEPEEVADLVAFLASEKAGYITGQTMQINGGMLMA